MTRPLRITFGRQRIETTLAVFLVREGGCVNAEALLREATKCQVDRDQNGGRAPACGGNGVADARLSEFAEASCG